MLSSTVPYMSIRHGRDGSCASKCSIGPSQDTLYVSKGAPGKLAGSLLPTGRSGGLCYAAFPIPVCMTGAECTCCVR